MADQKMHYAGSDGYTQVIVPGEHGVKNLDFGMLWLPEGEQYTSMSAGHEIGLIILTGTCDVVVGDQTYANLGGRATVFDGKATGVYIPCQTAYQLTAGTGGVEVALCRCLTTQQHPVQIIRPADVVTHDVGGAGFHRYVHDILGTNMQAATMIIGETCTIAGNWSSFPPHKHDVDALPDEVQQEELYLYKIRPAEGFGIQYFYTNVGSSYGPLDEAISVRQDDITVIPFGYHPVAAPPGYDVYYLWFLSGPRRKLVPNDDPAHKWIKTAGDEQREYPH